MRKIEFQIVHTGAPYPDQCWWKIVSSNGQTYTHSENMNLRNARRVIKNIISAIKRGKFKLVETGAMPADPRKNEKNKIKKY